MASRQRRRNPPPRKDTDPPTHDEDPIITLAEVARQTGKHVSTISRWVQSGLLEVVQWPSGLPAVRQSQVNAILGASALSPMQVRRPEESTNGVQQ